MHAGYLLCTRHQAEDATPRKTNMVLSFCGVVEDRLRLNQAFEHSVIIAKTEKYWALMDQENFPEEMSPRLELKGHLGLARPEENLSQGERTANVKTPTGQCETLWSLE